MAGKLLPMAQYLMEAVAVAVELLALASSDALALASVDGLFAALAHYLMGDVAVASELMPKAQYLMEVAATAELLSWASADVLTLVSADGLLVALTHYLMAAGLPVTSHYQNHWSQMVN